MTGDGYRYRVSVRPKDEAVAPFVLEPFAFDRHDAEAKAATWRRWGYTAWAERQLIVEPPPWERVPW